MDVAVESRYLNRELSWLEFNQRVLAEARNHELPLLERVKFLAITGSNLDEFFMVRVGSLQMLTRQKSTRPDATGRSPQEQLEDVSRRTHQMVRDQYRSLMEELEPALVEKGVRRLKWEELSDRQHKLAEHIFLQEVFPILTPIAVPRAEDFPPLINQTLNLCVRLKPAGEGEPERFAVIPFGRGRERFITLPGDAGHAYILLDDIASGLVNRFFVGEKVEECVVFRMTRNADLELREDLAFDLLQGMQGVLDARKLGHCVRLEIADSASTAMVTFLTTALDVGEQELFRVPGPLDLGSFMKLTDFQGLDELKYEAWPPKPSPQIDPSKSMFEEIAQKDILLYHPYESFEPVVRLVEEAANDPDVLAIKQTLYRTSRNSPIVAALKKAAQNGKNVTAVVELKARFDEARNIAWARNLEQADVQVIYGVKGLKTHAKICLIVRREPQGIQRYVHFGTGNYNEATSRLYGDASLLSCNDDLGADATAFFNTVTGYSQPHRFRKIDAAPIGLREKLLELIDGEIDRRKHGQRALIMLKLNALVDTAMIDALYAASQAGVKIRLNVRGICCLRPGIEGLSDNITVTSVVDRFLEHSRIFYFYHGGDERLFISSADWMTRNLDRRVELLVPVEDPFCRDRLIQILRIHLHDNAKAWRLNSDGTYERLQPAEGAPLYRSQQVLYERICEAVAEEVQARPTMFEPHRAPGTDDD